MQKIKKLNNKIKSFKQKINYKGEKIIKSSFKDFFKNHPSVDKIIWTGYTPYFNDGEPCVFNLNDFEIRFKKEFIGAAKKTADSEEDYCYGNFYEAESLNQEQLKDLKELNNFFKQCKKTNIKEIFKKIFGDHAKIIATIDGFKVMPYEHG